MNIAKAVLREKFTEKQAFLKKKKKENKRNFKQPKPPAKRVRKRRTNKSKVSRRK